MLNSKSVLFVSLLLATQLASAGGVILEKQCTPPFDQALNGTVMLEKSIIVQDKLAGGVIIERAADVKDDGSVILERGGIKLLSGGVIIERGIIVQKNQLAGGVVLENTPQPNGIIVHDRTLAGGLIIDRRGNGLIAESLTA